MKLLKHILSILLLLTLQLSFANSFASSFSNEELCVGNIKISEKGNPNSDFAKLSFKENNIFEPSFLENLSFRSVSFCEVYAELIQSWEKVDELVEGGDKAFAALKKDPDFLKKFDDVANDPHLNEHIFEGQVRKTFDPQTGNESWNAVGVHSNKAILDGKAELRTGKTAVGPSGAGYYEAKVKVYDPSFPQNGGWKSKSKPSTFFPDDWTPERIHAEIARVIKNNPNPVSAQGKLKYSGIMTDGVELRVFQNLDGSFETAFPFIP
jgi:hypothetical protein